MNQAQGSQPKGSNSGLIIVIIIVVMVVVLGVGGYFAWKSFGSKLFGGATSPSASPSAAVSVSPSVGISPSATPSPAPSLSTSKAISGDYVISDSDTRIIKEAEIRDFTPWQLKVARNEIYARYGRPFVHKDLQCYFATKSWYQKDESFTESELSATENKNVATIQAYEQKINSPLQSSDSGC